MAEPAGRPRPGDVSRPAGAATWPASGRARARSSGPATRGAFAFGLGAVLISSALWWLTGGLFDLQAGMIVVSVAIGWLIGTGVAWGAWGERSHPPERRLRSLAVVLGLLAWVAGSFLVYVFEQAVLPEANRSLLERMAALPFWSFSAQLFMPYGPFELLAIAIFAWRAAR